MGAKPPDWNGAPWVTLATTTSMSTSSRAMWPLADPRLQPGRTGRHARPADAGVQASAAALARLLHAHAHRRGPEPNRERHRRDRERRDDDRDVGALERDDRARDDRRHVLPRLAPRRVRACPAPALRVAHEARRRPAEEGDLRAAGIARGRVLDRPG